MVSLYIKNNIEFAFDVLAERGYVQLFWANEQMRFLTGNIWLPKEPFVDMSLLKSYPHMFGVCEVEILDYEDVETFGMNAGLDVEAISRECRCAMDSLLVMVEVMKKSRAKFVAVGNIIYMVTKFIR